MIDPSAAVLVLLVTLETETKVVHRGIVIVVVVGSGIGGQTRVTPGKAVTIADAELQIPGSLDLVVSIFLERGINRHE